MRTLKLPAIGALLAAAFCGAQAFAQSAGELFTVLNPTGNPPPIERRAMAPRPDSLDGKTIYLVDVTFNGGDLFLQEMQTWMQANMPEVNPIYRVKRGQYSTDDPELWREIQAEGGLMIMAIGH
jgi:ABC-type glycerol-3-phosphate transport system substrate-binding protein